MLKPEVIVFGDSYTGLPPAEIGTLFRFPDAEHMIVRWQADSVEVNLSTALTAEEVAERYEAVYGLAPQIDVAPPDEAERAEAAEKALDMSMILGPLCTILARTNDFQLAWFEVHQVFEDRPAETATVHMRQAGDELDFRHIGFLTAIAEANVRELIPKELPY